MNRATFHFLRLLVLLILSCSTECFGLIKEAVPRASRLVALAHFPQLGLRGIDPKTTEGVLLTTLWFAQVGEVNEAESLMQEMLGKASDLSEKGLILMFEDELVRSRFAVINDWGDEVPAEFVSVTQEKRKELESQFRAVLLSLPRDEALELLHSVMIGESLSEFSNWLTNTSRNLTSGDGQSEIEMRIEKSFEMTLDQLVENGGITVEEKKALNTWAQARIAMAHGDAKAAVSQMTVASGMGEELSDDCGKAYWLMELGDVCALPAGNLANFSYQLLSSEVIGNPDIEEKVGVPAAALQIGKDCYAKIAELTAVKTDPVLKYKWMLRQAWFAQMQKDPVQVIEKYAGAIRVAKSASLETAAARAIALSAILKEDRKAFIDAFGTMTTRGDLRGALGVAQCAEQRAKGLFKLHDSPEQAMRLILMTSDALQEASLNRAAYYVLSFEADLDAAVGKSDAAMLAYERQVQMLTDWMSEQAAYKKKEPKTGAKFDDPLANVNLAADELVMSLGNIAGRFAAAYLGDANPFWKQRLHQTLEEVLDISKRPDISPSVKSFVADSIARIQKYTDWTDLAYLIYSWQKAPNDFCASYKSARAKAKDKGVWPALLWDTDFLAAACGGELLDQIRSELVSADPLKSLYQACEIDKAKEKERSEAINLALTELNHMLGVASSLNLSDLQLQWIDLLEQTAAKFPEIQTDREWNEPMLKASMLLQTGDPKEASTLLCNTWQNDSAWRQLNDSQRETYLSALTEATIAGGEQKRSLYFSELRRQENYGHLLFRSGISYSARESAEAAKLVRKVSEFGSLDGVDARRLKELSRELEKVQRRSPVKLMPVEIERALANLPKDGIVLVYGALLNDELALWRIDAGGSIRICPLEIKGREVIRLKLDMLSILSNPTDRWKADARELYEQLVVPAGSLNVGSELIIVASGALSQIPFEILGENDDDRLLLSHPVVYANTICRSREFNPRSGEVRQRDFGRPIVVSSTSSNRPGIEQEGRIVAEKLGVNVLKSPSKEEFLAAISNAEIVHVASHGSFNSENPFMSYLLINPDEKVEGWELFSVGPRAKLLVFSACNTQTTSAALFRSQNAESFASFGLSGGPKWILGSLWQAEDAPTANLMQVFYSEMGSRFSDPTRPLQIAKKEMLSKGFTAHDFAGFILAVPDVEFLAKQP